MSLVDIYMSVPCFLGVANGGVILRLDDFLGKVNTATPWPIFTENWATYDA